MRKHQFGRIENLAIQGGQPFLTCGTKVVRIARLGVEEAGFLPCADDFDLKRPVRNLFEELERLQNGTVVKLEFRHGLPFLLETAVAACVESAPHINEQKG
jgi:hypothetical protein